MWLLIKLHTSKVWGGVLLLPPLLLGDQSESCSVLLLHMSPLVLGVTLDQHWAPLWRWAYRKPGLLLAVLPAWHKRGFFYTDCTFIQHFSSSCLGLCVVYESHNSPFFFWMELQRTSSLSGPLSSPGYTAQVPYNYNQLEGRFKQLQGKLAFLFSPLACC